MSRLIFDIETIGEDWNALDRGTQEHLTRWIRHEFGSGEGYEGALEDLKNGLGFSPLTGEIVAIGVLDYEKDQGVVYFQAPGTDIEEFSESGIAFKPMGEAEMLRSFWQGAAKYDEFITFNGRGFDAPFLMLRSAVHGVRPTKNLMEGRYAYQQRTCRHVDLLDELSFQGAVRRKPSLHLLARAFGIKSPKEDGVTGDDVGALFREKKFADIARYNAGDLRATKEVYDRWDNFIRM